jgi:hypothetical protein
VVRCENDIRRLDVTVHDTVGVRIRQSIQDFPTDPKCLVHREHPLARQTLPQSLTLQQGRNVKQEPLGLSRIVQRQDVRMRERGDEIDLAQETFPTQCGGNLRVENLYGHLARISKILGPKDYRRSATSDFVENAVSTVEGLAGTLQQPGRRNETNLRSESRRVIHE